MGRAHNSFTSFVGHAEETISDDRVTLPEKDLWVFMEGGPHFRLICEMAGRNPNYVQAKIRKVILRKNGWNVDVSSYSHYRQGPKTANKRGPKKKYLTGNAYYAKRAGKEMKKRNIYYQGMGAKGGRPRIYNVV